MVVVHFETLNHLDCLKSSITRQDLRNDEPQRTDSKHRGGPGVLCRHRQRVTPCKRTEFTVTELRVLVHRLEGDLKRYSRYDVEKVVTM